MILNARLCYLLCNERWKKNFFNEYGKMHFFELVFPWKVGSESSEKARMVSWEMLSWLTNQQSLKFLLSIA